VLHRHLTRLGARYGVVAPSLIPTKLGDRVKTDRRDATRLARPLRSGELTPIWVPDEEHEALRALTRAREDARVELLRARHRLGTFLLRLGLLPPAGVKPWSAKHRRWCRARASQEIVLREDLLVVAQAQDRRRRVEAELATAVTRSRHAAVIAALQVLRRVGLDVRHVLVEAAWHYRHAPGVWGALRRRQFGQPEAIKAIAWRAQDRLHRRYRRLLGRGKARQQVVVAVARELLGFV
jgi:hypothetical protein